MPLNEASTLKDGSPTGPSSSEFNELPCDSPPPMLSSPLARDCSAPDRELRAPGWLVPEFELRTLNRFTPEPELHMPAGMPPELELCMPGRAPPELEVRMNSASSRTALSSSKGAIIRIWLGTDTGKGG